MRALLTQRLQVVRNAILASGLLLCLGCGGSTPAPPPDADAGAESPKPSKPAPIKRVAANALPIGDPMPPLDNGLLQISRPKDWAVPSRDKRFVVQFQKGEKRFPRIQVTVEDDWSGFGDLNDLTPDDINEFVRLLAKRLESPEHKVKLIEPVIPMMIGNQAFARYVRRTRFKSTVSSVTVERQILVTVIAGRLYQIDLQTPPDTMLEHRDAAYAVAASMKEWTDGKSLEDVGTEPPESEGEGSDEKKKAGAEGGQP